MKALTPDQWAAVDTLFEQALERSPDTRSAFLRATCGDDVALYHVLTDLLAAEAEAEDVLGEHAADFALRLLETIVPPETAALPEGTRLGPYRIVGVLGEGGMGVVYRAARADDTFERDVAIKLVKRGMDTDEVLRRFHYERRLLASLDHPGIARLLDAGAASDGRPFLVMECVEGEPLTAYADRRGLGVPERLALLERVAEAVTYAHRRLVVHRDLKPSNILVSETEAGPQVKLLDFGIARLLDAPADDDAPHTRAGWRVLTPEYAAPEQRLGQPPTAATDVYALGVIAHELLVGVRPEPGDDAAPRLPSASVSAEAATARATTPERLRRTLRGDLDTLVRAALHADPARRYASAEALLDDLRRFSTGLPLRARPESLSYRLHRFVGRHRLGVAATVLVLLMLVGGTALTTARIAAERDAAQVERARAEATAAFVTGLFDAADPFSAVTERPDTLRARDLLARGADRARATLGAQPATLAEVLATIGRALAGLGLYADADAVLAEAEALPAPPAVRVRGLAERGRVQALGDAPAEGIGRLREALALAEAEVPETAPAVAVELGAALRRGGALAEAEAVLTRTSVPRNPLDRARLRIEQSRVALDAGRPLDAEPLLAEAQGLFRDTLRSDHPEHFSTLELLGNVYLQTGRLDEAAEAISEGLRIRTVRLGADHPHTTTARYHLAQLARDRGRTDEALAGFEAVLSANRRTLGADHPYVGYALNEIGITHGVMGNAEQAIAAYHEAIATLRRTLPEDHPVVTEATLAAAFEQVRLGQAREAEPTLRRVLALRQASLGADNWRTGVAESALGESLHRQGRLAEAEVHLVAGYQAIRSAGGPEGAALRRLVALYEETGREALAAQYRQRQAELSQ